MQKVVRALFAVILLGALCAVAVSPVFAGQPKVTIDYEGVNPDYSVNTVKISFAENTGTNKSTIETQTVYAGDYNLKLSTGQTVIGFCTDLWNSITKNETWQATEIQTSASNGLRTAGSTYATYGGTVDTNNVSAIDWIAFNYGKTMPNNLAGATTSAEAQLAIWDLLVGGQVDETTTIVKGKSVTTYSWADSSFVTTAFPDLSKGQTVFSANTSQSEMEAIYAMETEALALPQGNYGSYCLEVDSGTQTKGDGRPQDFVIAPEPAQIAVMLLMAALLLGRITWSRRRATKLVAA